MYATICVYKSYELTEWLFETFVVLSFEQFGQLGKSMMVLLLQGLCHINWIYISSFAAMVHAGPEKNINSRMDTTDNALSLSLQVPILCTYAHMNQWE